MVTPYVGEIRMFAGNFAPVGWLYCNGQTLSISDYEVLFNLIGTTYGGDGVQNFSLPNLMSRIPMHFGSGGGDNYVLGQNSGSETVALQGAQVPNHNHGLNVTSNGATSSNPGSSILSTATSAIYSQDPPAIGMAPGSIAATAPAQPHDNVMPFLVVGFIIATDGVYPSQN